VYQFPLPSPRRQDPRGPSPNLSLNRPPLNSGIHIAAEHLGIETNCCLNKQPLDSHSLTNPLTVLCVVRVVFATALIWVFSHLSCSGPRAICVWWWWYLLPRATCCVHTIIQYIILHYIPYTASTPCHVTLPHKGPHKGRARPNNAGRHYSCGNQKRATCSYHW
jgi:hypothetical protein